jgi:lysophospholipase L1-like esterase
VANLAAPRLTTYQALPTGSPNPPGRPAVDPQRNVSAALAHQPDAIVVNLPTNDAAMGFTVDETVANLERIVAEAEAVGIPVWVTTTQPRNLDAAGRERLVAGRDRFVERFGPRAIDLWTGLAAPDGTIDPAYDSGDGIHVNAAGHALIAERVAGAGIVGALAPP